MNVSVIIILMVFAIVGRTNSLFRMDIFVVLQKMLLAQDKETLITLKKNLKMYIVLKERNFQYLPFALNKDNVPQVIGAKQLSIAIAALTKTKTVLYQITWVHPNFAVLRLIKLINIASLENIALLLKAVMPILSVIIRK